MIQFGAFDATVAQADLQKYLAHANSLIGVADQTEWKDKAAGYATLDTSVGSIKARALTRS